MSQYKLKNTIIIFYSMCCKKKFNTYMKLEKLRILFLDFLLISCMVLHE